MAARGVPGRAARHAPARRRRPAVPEDRHRQPGGRGDRTEPGRARPRHPRHRGGAVPRLRPVPPRAAAHLHLDLLRPAQALLQRRPVPGARVLQPVRDRRPDVARGQRHRHGADGRVVRVGDRGPVRVHPRGGPLLHDRHVAGADGVGGAPAAGRGAHRVLHGARHVPVLPRPPGGDGRRHVLHAGEPERHPHHPGDGAGGARDRTLPARRYALRAEGLPRDPLPGVHEPRDGDADPHLAGHHLVPRRVAGAGRGPVRGGVHGLLGLSPDGLGLHHRDRLVIVAVHRGGGRDAAHLRGARHAARGDGRGDGSASSGSPRRALVRRPALRTSRGRAPGHRRDRPHRRGRRDSGAARPRRVRQIHAAEGGRAAPRHAPGHGVPRRP